MKRKLTVSPVGPMRKQPRQDPVSCESCRRKKLKCDRCFPCSSCSTRQLQCNYGDVRPGPSSPVNKLEGQIVDESTSGNRIGPTRPPQSTTHAAPKTRKHRRDDPTLTADWLETIVMGHRVPSAVPAPLRAGLSRPQRIESSQSSLNAISGNLLALAQGRITISHQDPANIHLPSFLPTKAEVMSLLDFYYNHLDYQYHLIVLHRTKRDIDTLYECIARDTPVNISHMAVVFSVVSVALFFQLLSTESAEFAEVCSREAVYLAGAALVQSNHAAYPTVEGLQASMIIGHQLSISTLSPSVSFLFLHGALITQAKSLGLHVVDCLHLNDNRKLAGRDRTEVEIKRRLWWDLASYDW